MKTVTAIVAHRIIELTDSDTSRMRMSLFDDKKAVAFTTKAGVAISIVPQPQAYDVDAKEEDLAAMLDLVDAVPLGDERCSRLRLPVGTWGIR